MDYSVIIPTHNEGDELLGDGQERAQLQSLLRAPRRGTRGHRG